MAIQIFPFRFVECQYEWDFEGYGTFEINSGKEPAISHTYKEEGIYEAKVKATDNDGAYTTSEHSISAIYIAPYTLKASVTNGPAPLRVNFTVDVDPEIAANIKRYKWDLDADGYFIKSTEKLPKYSYTYRRKGTYNARVMIIHNDDSLKIIHLPITVR